MIKNTLQILLNVYVNFIYTVAFSRKTTITFVVVTLTAVFYKLNLLNFFWQEYTLMTIFITQPFMYYSVYSSKSEKDVLTEFLEKNCSQKIFERFQKTKKRKSRVVKK